MKWLAIACIITYVAVFLTITFGCWPYASSIYYFHDTSVAYFVAAFQITGEFTLHHLVRCSLVSRIVKNLLLLTQSPRTLWFKSAERYCYVCFKCGVRI